MSYLSRRQLEKQMRESGRLPDGQSLTEKFPVLTYGPTPSFNLDTWDLRVFGAVKSEKRWTWEEFLQLPTGQMTVDIHCVTRWSKFDTTWEGVMFRDFLRELELTDEARFVIAHCDYGYTTNLSLEAMNDENVMLATKYDGRWLHDPGTNRAWRSAAHGGAQALFLEERQILARPRIQPGGQAWLLGTRWVSQRGRPL